jgi:hypothetical protein
VRRTHHDQGWMTSDTLHSINTAMYEVIKNSNYVAFGLHEIEILLGKRLDHRMSIPIIQLFVDGDLMETSKEILEQINLDASLMKHFKISRVWPADEFIPSHVLIHYKNKLIASVFSAEICEGYNVHRGLRIASINTIIRMYICIMLSSYSHFDHYTSSLECIVNALTILSNKSRMKPSQSKLFNDIVGQCYGATTGMVTLRKNRLMRMKNNKQT